MWVIGTLVRTPELWSTEMVTCILAPSHILRVLPVVSSVHQGHVRSRPHCVSEKLWRTTCFLLMDSGAYQIVLFSPNGKSVAGLDSSVPNGVVWVTWTRHDKDVMFHVLEKCFRT